jgi:hypothetical protein
MRIVYYDPKDWGGNARRAKGDHYLKLAMNWLRSEAIDKKQKPLAEIYDGKDSWELVNVAVGAQPLQTREDGTECGPACILNAGFLVDDVPLVLGLYDVSVTNYRLKLGCDLIRGAYDDA